MELIKRLMKDEEGQGLVEYALLIGLIALVAIGFLTNSGTSIKNIWNKVASGLNTADNKAQTATN